MSGKSRPASHAGSWYEGNPTALSHELDNYLAVVPDTIDGKRVPVPGARVIIAPYVPTAAPIFSSLHHFTTFRATANRITQARGLLLLGLLRGLGLQVPRPQLRAPRLRPRSLAHVLPPRLRGDHLHQVRDAVRGPNRRHRDSGGHQGGGLLLRHPAPQRRRGALAGDAPSLPLQAASADFWR